MGYDDDEPVIDCPICGAPMDKAHEHGVTIDFCDDHGVWLDAGELEDILARSQHRPRTGAKERAVQQYLAHERAKAEAKAYKKMRKKHAKKDFFYWLGKAIT